MPGAIYLLLILIFITMAVLIVKFYLQIKYGESSRYGERTPDARRQPPEDPTKVYFIRKPSAKKAAAPKLQQVPSKNLFVLEQVDANKQSGKSFD